jgi:large subunit ribosomal protein L3
VTIGLLGKKIGMTQIFDSKGNCIPVTIISSGPCYVTQLKSKEICGYSAVQLGYKEIIKNLDKLKKPELGHFTKANLNPFKYLKEYKVETISSYKLGDEINLSTFEIGEKICVTGYTIGKGNTGNIKLHNFNRGAMTHGSKHHRLQGSMGAGTSPGRVFPGKRMPRRSGMEKRTIRGLEIIDVNMKEQLLIIKGSVPGKPGNLLSLRSLKTT